MLKWGENEFSLLNCIFLNNTTFADGVILISVYLFIVFYLEELLSIFWRWIFRLCGKRSGSVIINLPLGVIINFLEVDF